MSCGSVIFFHYCVERSGSQVFDPSRPVGDRSQGGGRLQGAIALIVEIPPAIVQDSLESLNSIKIPSGTYPIMQVINFDVAGGLRAQ